MANNNTRSKEEERTLAIINAKKGEKIKPGVSLRRIQYQLEWEQVVKDQIGNHPIEYD